MFTVYEFYSRRVVFEGDLEACRAWIFQWAFTFKDGRKIYRTWEEDGETVYDVGSLYILK